MRHKCLLKKDVLIEINIPDLKIIIENSSETQTCNVKNIQEGSENIKLRSDREDDSIETSVQESTEKTCVDSDVAHSDDGKSSDPYLASTSQSDSNMRLHLKSMPCSLSTRYSRRWLGSRGDWNVASFANANHVDQQLENLQSDSVSQLIHSETKKNTVFVPKSYSGALTRKHYENWLEALQSRFDTLNKLGT